MVAFVAWISLSNLAAELLRPTAVVWPTEINSAPTSNQVSSAGWWASTIAPFRSDLKAEYALALAGQALKSDAAKTETGRKAQEAVVDALSIGPHDSRMWLVLALLRARSNPGNSAVAGSSNSQVAEPLKMSYLTGPNREELIPTRLTAVIASNSLDDADLNEFARGDVRAILTRIPDQRQTLMNTYTRASTAGKTFLEDSARAYDPRFVDSLRGKK
ncbi:MAG: hypothetical protein KGL35_28880 [Bradyrhizobium sp.]|nr:hypothetical protein [Bradyrhizobium sp.]